MKVLVVGAGYVGLVTGVCLAAAGHQVLCVDHDCDKVTSLQAGRCPIHEEGLEGMLQAELTRGNIQFTNRIPEFCQVDVALVAVGTPPREDGSADLRFVFHVVDELANKLSAGVVVGTKSTVPVGTAISIRSRFKELHREDLQVVSVPEFLREGTAVEDTLRPHRLVFGISSESALQVLQELHIQVPAPVVHCDPSTAEMIKYASNAFLATKISFINEIANICERVDADVRQVAEGMGLDPRIGASFLRPGLGYGGSCFPKDTRALVNIAGSVDYDFTLLKSVVQVNQRQKFVALERLREWLGHLEDKKITLLGVAFKPGTDDVRESPAIELAEVLASEGAVVEFCDPVVHQFVNQAGVVRVLQDPYEALFDADAAVLVTEWPEFLDLDWPRVYRLMNQPRIFDGRNVIEPSVLESFGFVQGNIGRKAETVATELLRL